MSSSSAASKTTASSASSLLSVDDQFAGLHPAAPATTMSAGVQSSAPIHFGNHITVKLSAETHLLWRAQVVSLLRSNLLHGFVEGTYPCPSSTIAVTKDGAQETTPNPAFAAWLQQDQAILSALHSSSTVEVGAMIMFAESSAEAWNIIERSFAARTTARASQIRAQLVRIKKLDTTASVFFNKVKALSDTLASIGHPLRPDEFQNYLLDGLDEDYDNLVETIKGRDDPMSAQASGSVCSSLLYRTAY
jgi:hypothetical protein